MTVPTVMVMLLDRSSIRWPVITSITKDGPR